MHEDVPSSDSPYHALSPYRFQSGGHRCGGDGGDWLSGERDKLPSEDTSGVKGKGSLFPGYALQQGERWMLKVDSHPAISHLNPQGTVGEEPAWPSDSNSIS